MREEKEKHEWLNRPAFVPEPYVSEAEQRRIEKEEEMRMGYREHERKMLRPPDTRTRTRTQGR